MRHKSTSSKNGIEELEAKLKAAHKKIRELKTYIKEQEANFHLSMFEGIEAITHNYSVLLDPYPVKIRTSDKGNSGVYELKVTDVVCVVSNDRVKKIYLRKKVADIEGRASATSLVSVNRNNLTIQQMRQELDSIGYHLIQVGRGVLVNTMYYKNQNLKLELALKDVSNTDILSFKISKDYLRIFTEKQKDLKEIVLLHKTFVRYITANEGN